MAVKNVLIIGAGEAGRMVLREVRGHSELNLRVAGFVDDDPAKSGQAIDGVPVLGGKDAIPAAVAREQVGLVIIAIPSAPGRVIRAMVSACAGARVEVRIVPGIFEIIAGEVRLNQIREVKVEDLLGRETVRVESGPLVQGKRVLVTGAAGSIGSELCRQILRGGPEKLTGLDCGETEMFYLDHELGVNPAWCGRIGDIRDESRLQVVFAAAKPHLVFHAAAYKHVSMMETNPGEAVKTNVFGTRAVLRAAVRAGVERFVFISSDKAVNPTSVMGATKRVAERLVLHTALHKPLKCAVVRFGNVLASRGSVVNIFRRQIEQGGPVTVTHPEALRYFMTVAEAAQLVIQAGAMGERGEIFLLEMGDPINITDLARNMITLCGLEPDEEIKIAYTGLRPGEKLKEELLTAGEGTTPTAHPKIYLAQPERLTRDLDAEIEKLARHTRVGDEPDITRCLAELVPGFIPATKPGC